MFSKRHGSWKTHLGLSFDKWFEIYISLKQPKSQNSWQILHHFRFLYLLILTLLQPHFVSPLLPFLCMRHSNQRDRNSRGVNGTKKWAVKIPFFLLYPLRKFVSTASNIKCALNVRVKRLLVQRIAPRLFVHIRRSSRNL